MKNNTRLVQSKQIFSKIFILAFVIIGSTLSAFSKNHPNSQPQLTSTLNSSPVSTSSPAPTSSPTSISSATLNPLPAPTSSPISASQTTKDIDSSLLKDAFLIILGAIVGTGVGRFWKIIDQRTEKDKEQIRKILTIIPAGSEALRFLRRHDFGSPYRGGQTAPFWELERLLSQPSYFFMNKKLENAKEGLHQEIVEFQDFIATNMFLSDRHDDLWELQSYHDVVITRVMMRRSDGETVTEEEISKLEKKFWEDHNITVQKLNQMASNICDKYDILMKIANRM